MILMGKFIGKTYFVSSVDYFYSINARYFIVIGKFSATQI